MRDFSISISGNDELWSSDPEKAFADWQTEEATGSDRRPFAERSIIQHRAMFARFHRYLAAHRQTVATFGEDHVAGFFDHISADCAPGTTTHIRYLKLIDRFTRHLVAIDARKDNPAADLIRQTTWPEDEPTPVYLSLANDKRLQQLCRTPEDLTFKRLRNVAVVALFLGAGISAAECRNLKVEDLNANGMRPDIFVEKRGPRIGRRVPLDAFSIDVLRDYLQARAAMRNAEGWLFVATAAGKPMTDHTLGQCVRALLLALDVTAADMSPRLLRNTYGR
jgi:site-specific recombinase XerD